LKSYLSSGPKENRGKTEAIIKLYEEKKIVNFKTALNVVMLLSSRNKRSINSGRPDKEYNKVVAKYTEAEPMTGRLERERLRKEYRTFSATILLFKQAEANDDDNIKVDVPSSSKSDIQEIKKTLKRRMFKGLHQFFIGSFDMRLNGEEEKFMNDSREQLIDKVVDKKAFKRIVELLIQKNVIFKDLMESTGKTYLRALYIFQSERTDKTGKAFEPKKSRNRDDEKIAAYYQYSSTQLDLSKKTFKEAITLKHYNKNECFINSILDFYSKTLISYDRKRIVITRDKILKLIDKTEETVKYGITIEEIMPFFEYYKLPLRVYNRFYKKIHQYDPPVNNHRNPAMYVLQADEHIYTLKHNINQLEQKQDAEAHTPTTSSDYIVKEGAEAKPSRMIDTIDDILDIARELQNTDIRIIYLIHQKYDLIDLLYQLINAGYSPGINFEAGRITNLKLEFNDKC
jgi:hypothetical protein